MTNNLKCFISASYNYDISSVKNLLTLYGVETYDLYDFSVGDSIQEILKRKIRETDFSIFIITDENPNVIYEMGICEGLGKPHFILLDKNLKVPFYIESKLFIRTDVNDNDFIKNSIEKLLIDMKNISKKNNSSFKSSIPKKNEYNNEIQQNIKKIIPEIQQLRYSDTNRSNEFLMEKIVAELFNTIQLNYVVNNNIGGKGVDFALWSDELGKVIGNPIIVELKLGNIDNIKLQNAENQIKRYLDISDAKIGILLYLDKNDRRHIIKSSIQPLMISYDLEDFANDLVLNTFETLVLNQRNNIAHGIK